PCICWLSSSYTPRIAKVGLKVAPRTGAWIETRGGLSRLIGQASLPARERGLKRVNMQSTGRLLRSLPARERGLKPAHHPQQHPQQPSLPARERGLKQERAH
ncbi:hypothetical protein, partial [Candidatus Brocadia sapporoensis]|uniref:hypothetical protein n=1 Tax=Candidatus Brocadia sapporoensis TaxID=392547 RepID=UPI001E53B44F